MPLTKQVATGPVSGAWQTAMVAPAPALKPVPAAMEISSLPPLTILDNGRVVMKNYGSAFGENPVGTNLEITEALLGKNP